MLTDYFYLGTLDGIRSIGRFAPSLRKGDSWNALNFCAFGAKIKRIPLSPPLRTREQSDQCCV
jgi:hypothetical protein